MEWMFMPLKRYAEFSGRSRRKEYWMWTLFQVLLYVAIMVVMMMVGGGAAAMGDPNAASAAGGAAIAVLAVYGLLVLAFFIPSIAVTVRRLHDTNRSGWWVLAPVIPYAVMALAMGGALASGTEGGIAAAGLVSLVAIVAVIGLGITLLVFMCLDGTPGPNRFGPDPKQRGHEEVFA